MFFNFYCLLTPALPLSNFQVPCIILKIPAASVIQQEKAAKKQQSTEIMPLTATCKLKAHFIKLYYQIVISYILSNK